MKGYKKKGISIEEWNERRGRNMKGYKKKGTFLTLRLFFNLGLFLDWDFFLISASS